MTGNFERPPMKPKETKKADNGKKAGTETGTGTEMEDVIKLLKKKELQTKILKKIIPDNQPHENKPKQI